MIFLVVVINFFFNDEKTENEPPPFMEADYYLHNSNSMKIESCQTHYLLNSWLYGGGWGGRNRSEFIHACAKTMTFACSQRAWPNPSWQVWFCHTKRERMRVSASPSRPSDPRPERHGCVLRGCSAGRPGGPGAGPLLFAAAAAADPVSCFFSSRSASRSTQL